MQTSTTSLPHKTLAGRAAMIGIACYMASMLAAWLLQQVTGLSYTATNDPRKHLTLYTLGAVLLAPILETILIAAIDVMSEAMPKPKKLLLSVALMCLLHGLVDNYSRAIFVITPFLFFCYTYYFLAATGKQGYWLSVGVHATHNLIACIALSFD